MVFKNVIVVRRLREQDTIEVIRRYVIPKNAIIWRIEKIDAFKVACSDVIAKDAIIIGRIKKLDSVETICGYVVSRYAVAWRTIELKAYFIFSYSVFWERVVWRGVEFETIVNIICYVVSV